jgi:hypothetical protein
VGKWGFIALAYGVGAGILLGYLGSLRARLKDAQATFLALAEGRRR